MCTSKKCKEIILVCQAAHWCWQSLEHVDCNNEHRGADIIIELLSSWFIP